jgi:hypothetical protein
MWRQNGATLRFVATIQIKNVPDEVHRELQARARYRGQSLQQFLLHELSEKVSRPSLQELYDSKPHTGGSLSLEEAARLVRQDRDSQ